MNTRTIGIIIFMGAIMFFSCFAKENEKKAAEQFTSISMDEAAKLMEMEKDFILVDVRRPDEYKSGHIPGAVLLTNETITEESAARILKNKNQKILVYCRSGQRSRVAAGKLSSMGYTNVVNIGGIMSWKGKIEK
jgi:putative phage shock protein E